MFTIVYNTNLILCWKFVFVLIYFFIYCDLIIIYAICIHVTSQKWIYSIHKMESFLLVLSNELLNSSVNSIGQNSWPFDELDFKNAVHFMNWPLVILELRSMTQYTKHYFMKQFLSIMRNVSVLQFHNMNWHLLMGQNMSNVDIHNPFYELSKTSNTQIFSILIKIC